MLDYDHSLIEEETINFEDYDPNDENEVSWIRFIVTTKRLLQNSANSKIIHADATQKLIVQRYPVLVFGTTDLDAVQHFHLVAIMVSKHERTDDFYFGFAVIRAGLQKIENVEFNPEYLMADAAGAIHAAARRAFGSIKKVLMCYANVKTNVNKQKLNNTKANH